MKLVVDFDDLILKQSAKGSKNPLFTLYWTQGEQVYPEPQWIDSGSVVLSWWLVSARALLEGATKADFSFVEGPFSLTARRLGNQLTVTDTAQTWNTKVLTHRFVSELLTATEQVLRKFAELGIEELNGLRTGMRQLQIASSEAGNTSRSRALTVSLTH